jgi:hypothetical protein
MNLKSGKHYKTKFLAIHSASLESKKEDEVNHRCRRDINFPFVIKKGGVTINDRDR